MIRFLTLTTIVFIIKTAAAEDSTNFLSDEFIDFINRNQSLWRAGRNFREDLPLSYFKLLAGTIIDNSTQDQDILDDVPPYEIDFTGDNALPEKFDVRLRWPKCTVMNNIRDQGSCGSCWAVAAAAAMTDRFCIASEGKQNFYFASGDALSCCLNCGSGCGGGVLKNAWSYYKRRGIVSGGEYESHEGCKPYQVPPCNHRYPPNSLEPCGYNVKTPLCTTVCEKNYEHSYGSDKKRGKQVYPLQNDDVLKDIFTRGPVTATFNMFADFLSYQTGIYRHVPGSMYLGLHSVKLMGWGVENGVKYWLAANTWNDGWGGNSGFFKILRGENHCSIESSIFAGI